MSRHVEVSYNWRGRDLTIKAEMAPAEHDVGIPSPYPVGMTVLTSEGEKVEMSDAEMDSLGENEELQNKLIDAYYQEA